MGGIYGELAVSPPAVAAAAATATAAAATGRISISNKFGQPANANACSMMSYGYSWETPYAFARWTHLRSNAPVNTTPALSMGYGNHVGFL